MSERTREESGANGIDIERIKDLFGLTAGEARVALALAQGDSPRQITKRMGISYQTVRTHLKHVFKKTGIRRQAALVRLLWTLSPTRPPLQHEGKR